MSHDRAAFAGQIADVRVHELLLTILEGRHTGVASFQTEVGSATLWFRDGEVVDADMGRHHMERAVGRLLPLVTGSFEVEFKAIDRRRVITTSTAELIAPYVEPERLARGSAADAPHGDLPSAGDDDQADDEDATRISLAPGRTTGRTRRPAAGWRPTAGGGGRAGTSESERGEAPAPPIASAAPPRPVARKTMSWSRNAGPPPDAAGPGEDPRARLAALRRAAPVPHDAMLGDLEEATLRAGEEPAPPSAPEPPPPVVRFAPPPSPSASASAAKTVPAASVASVGVATPTVAVQPAAAPSPAAPTEASTAPASPARAEANAGVPTTGHVAEAPLAKAEMPAPPPRASDAPAAFASGTIGRAVEDEGSDPTRRTGRSRRAAASVAVPFEPERLDRTLMRAAPFPPARPVPRPDPTTQPGPEPAMHPPSVVVAHAGHPPAGGVHDTLQLPATGGEPETPSPSAAPVIEPAVTGRTAPPPGGGQASRGLTERFDIKTGPRGTFVLPDPNDPPPRHEAGAPQDTRWPDSAPIDTGFDGQSPRQQITPAPAPAVVGRYEVLLRIARGGMGTVYLCRVTGEGGFRRLFALKVIRDHLSANPEYVAMLLQEARIASRLHHPNVVSIVDIGTLANQHYLVMDYVEGCTFSELLKAHPKSRPPQLVVPIVIDALTGLHSAHTLTEDDGRPFPLVHCDFSPQNMLVGVGGICRIADFGISKAADALPDRSGITRGKPGYLSPEQVLGHRVDPRSDIFSAGIVLWNALTGERLFDAPTPEATLDQVLNKPIPRPSTVGLRPPACFDAICLTALERDPNRRYQSAEQMLVELRRAAVAHDLLATQSDVAKWVQDTFGHQIELRRQAAGIAPRPIPGQLATLGASALQLSGVAAASGGHPPPERREGSDTGAFSSAGSRTAILRSDVSPATPMPAPESADAGLGARARAAVFVLSALVAGAIMAVLIVQPDMLRGGVLDDDRDFHPWVPPPPPGHGLMADSDAPGNEAPGGEPEGASMTEEAEETEETEGAAGHPGTGPAHVDDGGAPTGAAEGGAADLDPPPPEDETEPPPPAAPAGSPPRAKPTKKDPRAPKKTRGKAEPKPPTADGGDPPAKPEPTEPAPVKPDPPAPEPAKPTPAPTGSPFPSAKTPKTSKAPPSSDDAPSIPPPP